MTRREAILAGCLVLGVVALAAATLRTTGPARAASRRDPAVVRSRPPRRTVGHAPCPVQGSPAETDETPFTPEQPLDVHVTVAGPPGPAATRTPQLESSRVDVLDRLLAHDSDPGTKQSAADSLAAIGTPSACLRLIRRAAEGGEDAPCCLLAIERITSSHAQETLVEAAYDRALPADVRCAAVVALSNHRSRRVRMLLSNLAENEPNEEVCLVAAEAAGDSGPADDPGTARPSTEAGHEVWF